MDKTKKKKKTQGASKNKGLKHDSLFKKFFDNQIAAKEFLEYYLPDECRQLVDLSKPINLSKDSFIEQDLKNRFCDLLMEVQTKDNEFGYVYFLCENQNTSDKTMPLRIWRYVTLIMQRHLDLHGTSSKIPLIVPFVYHTGRYKYTPPRNLWQMFKQPSMAKKFLSDDHLVVDLSQTTNDEIRNKRHLGMLEFFLKNAKRRDLMQVWEEFFQLFSEMIEFDKENDYIYLRYFICYTDPKVSADQQAEFNDLIISNLPIDDRENIMRSIADVYKEEWMNKGLMQGLEQGLEKGLEQGLEKGLEQGLEKGLEQGKAEGKAEGMLACGADPRLVAKVTNLTLEQVQEIAKSIKILK